MENWGRKEHHNTTIGITRSPH